jgi:hypothetical protein
MGIKKTLEALNRMEADGVIGRYAISGAVAAYNYIEPAVTEVLDILVSFQQTSDQPNSGLITLAPVLAYLQARGYAAPRKEGILIEDWPVQLLPVASDLDAEALARAEDVEVGTDDNEGSVWTRVLRPEHLVAICLRVGRPNDLIRIAQFIEEDAVHLTALCDTLRRPNLMEKWQSYCHRTGIGNPCD